MGRIDNDRTKGLAVPFLILAHVRTGGTFCAHALSNHPQIYCDRGETLHHLSTWRQNGVGVGSVLGTIWGMDGYHAAGFRAIYRQAFHRKVWPLILKRRPRLIHLVRRDVARQGVSFGYQQMVRSGELPFHPVHSFEERAPAPVRADPERIVGYAIKVREEMERGRQRVGEYPGHVLEVAYEEMASNLHTCPGGQCQGIGKSKICKSANYMDAMVSKQICEFLGVEWHRLRVDLRRDFTAPMAEWFENWGEIRRELKRHGFQDING